MVRKRITARTAEARIYACMVSGNMTVTIVEDLGFVSMVRRKHSVRTAKVLEYVCMEKFVVNAMMRNAEALMCVNTVSESIAVRSVAVQIYVSMVSPGNTARYACASEAVPEYVPTTIGKEIARSAVRYKLVGTAKTKDRVRIAATETLYYIVNMEE